MSRFLFALLSAGLHTLALPPWDVAATAWFALVPFLHALRGLSPGRGALLGLFWGSAIAWGFGFWVPAALTSYYQQPAWFGAGFALAASIVFCGSYYAGFAATLCWIARRSNGAVGAPLTAALWVTWELARARLLSGDPWLLFGYAALPCATLVQIADLGGVYLLSFVLVLANASLSEAAAQRRPHPLLPAATALLATYAYGAWRIAEPAPDSPRLPILIVQGNNDLGAQWREELYGEGLRPYLRLTLAGGRNGTSRLVVWPESAVTFFLAREDAYRASIARVLRTVGADLIVGGPHLEDPDPVRPAYFNSAFHLDTDGRVRGRYDKVHLLPFAEYFPLRTIELLRRRFERVRSFTPGAAPRLLDTEHGKIATAICFEAIFPELVRRAIAGGADFLVNLSNDAWLGSRAGREQHLAMVSLRAVENRTWIVRATTTGISAVIDPFGRIVARSDSSLATTLRAEIAARRRTTFYTRHGDLFAGLCLLASTLAAAMAIATGRHARATAAGRNRSLGGLWFQ